MLVDRILGRTGRTGRTGLLTFIVKRIWTYTTFFVVPLIVMEGIGPIAAIKRSGTLLQDTWGTQVVADFSFALFYGVAWVVAVFGLLMFVSVSPLVGLGLGIPLVAIAGVPCTHSKVSSRPPSTTMRPARSLPDSTPRRSGSPIESGNRPLHAPVEPGLHMSVRPATCRRFLR